MLSDSLIFDMVQTLPFSSFKDASTGKYILTTDEGAAYWRLDSPAQIVGLTLADLSTGTTKENVGPVQSRLSKAYATQTTDMDRWVREQKRSIKATRIGLRFGDGNLTYESVAKLPIVGEKNLLGIVTYGMDLTSKLSLRSLYLLYANLFDRKEAIERFLRHVDIDRFFFVPPTPVEILVLVERSTGKSNSEIARQLKVVVRTVEAHMSNIRNKLKGDMLSLLFAHLRNRNEVTVEGIQQNAASGE